MSVDKVGGSDVDMKDTTSADKAADDKLKAAMVLMGTELAFEMLEEEEENEQG